ncbi:hypothetical protein COB57_06245 [Candidatus Peregrinibacteria bacterium]|nr:MAG: hypothetical protein COB57_06245 [Candidatus Peregrinibacteria bacterium]
MKFYNAFLSILILSFAVFVYTDSQKTDIYVIGTDKEVQAQFSHDIALHKEIFLNDETNPPWSRNPMSEKELLNTLEKLIYKYENNREMLTFFYKQSSYLLVDESNHSLFIHTLPVPKDFQADRNFLLNFLSDTPELFPHLSYELRNDKDFVKKYIAQLPDNIKNTKKMKSILMSMESNILNDQEMQKILIEYTPETYLLLSDQDKTDKNTMRRVFAEDPAYFQSMPLDAQSKLEHIKILQAALWEYNKTELLYNAFLDHIVNEKTWNHYEELDDNDEQKIEWEKIKAEDERMYEELNDYNE